jgi:hypothetical protein
MDLDHLEIFVYIVCHYQNLQSSLVLKTLRGHKKYTHDKLFQS